VYVCMCECSVRLVWCVIICLYFAYIHQQQQTAPQEKVAAVVAPKVVAVQPQVVDQPDSLAVSPAKQQHQVSMCVLCM
jgi:hypothetical protein